MKRNSKNKKKLTSVRIMNSVSLNSTNIMNSANIFNNNVAMNSVGSITPPKFPKNVQKMNEYYHFIWGHIIHLLYSKVMKPTHMPE